jgi:hypothetical protein
MWNPRHGGRNNRKGRCLGPEGPGPKPFRSNVSDARFLKHFWAPSNVVKYNGKTNPSMWLEDYRLACRVDGVDDDLFIIQLLPIYLADSARAWLYHLLSYPVFIPKLSTHHMHDPWSIVPHIRPKVFTDNQMSWINYNYYINNVSKDYDDSQQNRIAEDSITPLKRQPGQHVA